jgi:hypothetical protein
MLHAKPPFTTTAISALLVVGSAAPLRAQPCYTVAKSDTLLREIDVADGTTLNSVALTLAGNTISNATGLAMHPVTGALWGLLKVSIGVGRALVTIDPQTGVCTLVGDTGGRFAGIAFDSGGTLYAVTGDGELILVKESLYTLSTVDATPTFVRTLGNGANGEALGYNFDDGLLYHASGTGVQNTSKIFETIDPIGLAVTNVPLSGAYNQALGLQYQGAGVFLLTDLTNQLHRLSTGGIVRLVGTLDHTAQGVAEVPGTKYLTVSPNDDLLREIDATDASTVGSVTLTLAGETIEGGTGLAWDPVSARLFGLLKLTSQPFGRELVIIDPATGVCTAVGDTNDEFVAIVFDAAGTLFAVTDDLAFDFSSLFTLSTVDATPTFLDFLGNGTDGEALGYNPDDGLLYHASGIGPQNVFTIFESIHSTTLVVTNIPLLSDYEEGLALAYEGAGRFLLTDLSSGLYEVTTTGEVTSIAVLDHQAKGIVVAPADADVPGVSPAGLLAMTFLMLAGAIALLTRRRIWPAPQ